jgi:hypothetical protein
MTFVFFLQHPGFLRFFGPTIATLAERGHRVHVAFGRTEKDDGDAALAEQLTAAHAGVTTGPAPERRDAWRPLAAAVRSLTDAARYRDERFRAAPKLRARAFETAAARLRLPQRVVAVLASPRLLPLLRGAERALPSSRAVEAYLRERRADVVVVSPLVDFGTGQVEYVKSAAALGIPSAVCVASWDNLTNKGLLKAVPDRVLVWNEVQRHEAIELHGVPAERVVATGAPKFDEWFERAPSTTAAAFAAKVGLPGPFVLYLCSSPFVAPDEVSFVRDWLGALRQRSDAPVLIRPHPQNAAQWRDVDLGEHAPVAIRPRAGAQPDAGESRADFYDSLAHATAVVGINTSGLIEAAIAGREVFTVLDPRFAGTQEGTLHFHHLRAANGGFLHEAATLDEHLDQLLGGERDPARTRDFVARFVRPRGAGARATDVLADELEALRAARDRVPGEREPRRQ